MRAGRFAAVVVAALIAAPDAAAAQSAGPAVADQAKPPKTGAKEPPKYPRFRWQDHPSIQFGRGTRIDLRARLQSDLRASEAPQDDDEAGGLDLARRRVGIEGEIAGRLAYQVEAQLGDAEIWRDVYVNYRQADALQVRAGKFKLPFSLDENTSATSLDFAYRSMAATRLAPGRDRGVMVHGRAFGRAVGYEAGVFDRDGRNARPADQGRTGFAMAGRTLAARVSAQPFRKPKSAFNDFQVGVAYTRADVTEGVSALRARTALGASFFSPDLFVRGARTRVGVEFRWRPGPFSAKAEYIRVTTERLGQSVRDGDLPAFVAEGWYVSGTWVLTGENKAGGLDRPRRPLFRGGIGAVEAAVRLQQLSLGDVSPGEDASVSPRAIQVQGNANRVATFGLNWYVNRWIKIQGNLIQEDIAHPAEGPLPSRARFWSRVLRFQLSI